MKHIISKKLINFLLYVATKKNIMSNNNCVNNSVPEYVPQDLPWYERDGLMTYYNQVKCQEFLRNSDNHFKAAKIINFVIVRREAVGEKVPVDLLRKYQTVQH